MNFGVYRFEGSVGGRGFAEDVAGDEKPGGEHGKGGEAPRGGIDQHEVAEGGVETVEGTNPSKPQQARAENGDEGRGERISETAH